ncbi:MAG: DUF3857 domain-containing transglutaminase family protein [Cyclobacteriaceae bacterium]
MKTFRFLIFCLFCVQAVYSQSSYRISDIPDSLKENANVVYFVDEGSFEILEDEKAVFRSRKVVAILNSKGKERATQYVGYDKLRKILSFKGKVYDKNGDEIKKLRNSDIQDMSSTSGGTIFDDNRLQYADLKQKDYPYIVEFEYEVLSKYTYRIPTWTALPGQNVSVMKSSYEIRCPKKYKPNTKLVNSNNALKVNELNDKVSILFETENLKAIERESYGPSTYELFPILYATSSYFNFDGYEGSFNSWNDMGKWQIDLNKGRQDLPQKTLIEIRKITDAFDSREDKIRAVYQYVQEKTRYVSIQLGIGGFQPFPASTVDELGYGDCKALSNYTYSLLKSIGINSHYTWVYGGSNPPKIDRNFPNDPFNHIILCVPNKQDTIWLECTSQTNPFGYQGSFTGDRDVMVVTENGGKVVHTTIYGKELNTQHTKANVNVEKDGTASANVKTVYSGLQYENNSLNYYIDYDVDRQKKWIYKNTQVADFTVSDFDFQAIKEKVPSVTQTMEIDIPRLARPNGKRVFLELNLLNKSTSIPTKYEERKTDLVLKFQGVDIDSIVYEIPQHLHAEYIPKPIEIETEFGKYSATAHFENSQLIYVRRMEYNKGRFDKSKYEEYREFKKRVVKADKAKVVFIDKT